MLKESGGLYLNKEEQCELLDRVRRTETRIVKLLLHHNMDCEGRAVTTVPNVESRPAMYFPSLTCEELISYGDVYANTALEKALLEVLKR